MNSLKKRKGKLSTETRPGFLGEFYQTFKKRINTKASQTLPKKQKKKEFILMESLFLCVDAKTKSSQEKKTTDHYPSHTDIKVFKEILADQDRKSVV